MEDHSHAGQGPVMLDIGGDVGALVIEMPAALAGVEVEARPVGPDQPGHLPHVAVLPRPTADGRQVHSAVFGSLIAGPYQLYQRPSGPIELTVEVRGGAVAEAVWPAPVGR